MRITIRLFAGLRDVVGAGTLVREVPAGATVRSVWEMLSTEFPDLDRYASSVSSAVNAEYTRMTSVVRDEDEVAFLPPVSGG